MAKKLKLSPWHDVSLKPVRKGVYQVKDAPTYENYYSFFDGKLWNGFWNLDTVMHKKDFAHISPDGCTEVKKWRGIIK